MTNILQFWTLQHLYVILSLVDIREIGDIVKINHVFSTLHPEVEKMEEKQNDLRDRVQPLIKKKNELAQRLKALEWIEWWISEVSALIDDQKDLDNKLEILDKELQEIQWTIPEFVWDKDCIETIREAIPAVFETLWTQHEKLSGYRRIKATTEIIYFFEIPAVSL